MNKTTNINKFEKLSINELYNRGSNILYALDNYKLTPTRRNLLNDTFENILNKGYARMVNNNSLINGAFSGNYVNKEFYVNTGLKYE